MKLQVKQMFRQSKCEYVTMVIILPCALINLMSFNPCEEKYYMLFFPFNYRWEVFIFDFLPMHAFSILVAYLL